MEKNKLNGWVVIDKPLGMTSTQVIGRVRKLLGVKKIGHVGTLDPLASGVLPLAIGEATKTIAYVPDSTKEYVFTIFCGLTTPTGDLEGVSEGVLTQVKKPISAEKIQKIIPQFLGKIKQVPPIYSAIKTDGVAAYKKARRGESIVMHPREVEIFELDRVRQDAPHLLTMRCVCSSGTYIRTLAQDLAAAVGEKGVVSFLRRVRSGVFKLDDAFLLEKLENIVHTDPESLKDTSRFFVSLDKVLADILVLSIKKEQEKSIRMGQEIPFESKIEAGTLVRVVCEDRLVALANVANGFLKPIRVFNF